MNNLYVITNGKNWIQSDTKGIKITNKISEAKLYELGMTNHVIDNLPKPMKNLGYRAEEIQLENLSNINIQDLLSKTEAFESFFIELTDLKNKLPLYYSIIDKSIDDILHLIEFERFNACEGYKYAKMLKDFREKRRQVKNYLEVIGYMEKMTIEDIVNQNASKTIKGMLQRNYNPKILHNIFKDGEYK